MGVPLNHPCYFRIFHHKPSIELQDFSLQTIHFADYGAALCTHVCIAKKQAAQRLRHFSPAPPGVDTLGRNRQQTRHRHCASGWGLPAKFFRGQS